MIEKAMEPRYSRQAYIEAKRFLHDLYENRGKLTNAEYMTLKRLALSGNIDGATKGLARLTRR